MFGYITADPTQLSQEEQARYSGCYCGLCHRLGALCGQHTRLTLTYDVTFLVLVLNALYTGEERPTAKHCPPHPIACHPGWFSRWTDYGAWMNLALSYYKCMDDWKDERRFRSLLAAWLLRPALGRARRLYPRQCAAIAEELHILSQIEQRGLPDPDATSASFGRLMAALFVVEEGDAHAPHLYQLGFYLGQFIYLMDARLDLAQDLQEEAYNPLTGLVCPDLGPTLTMLLSQASAAAECLPLQKDRHLIYNILYAGVWLKYEGWKAKREDANHVRPLPDSGRNP